MTQHGVAGVLFVLGMCAAGAACGDDPAPAVDRDGDGLSDEQEGMLGTDPNQVDSDHDGVSDYGDDLDGDGVSNSEEIARGTAEPPRTSAPSAAAGSSADQDAPAANDEPADGAIAGAASEPPSEPPSETPNEPPIDATPDQLPCAELREKCAAGDLGACEMLKLEGGCQLPPTSDKRTCDTLWAQCVANQRRACQAFIGGCELPDCDELKVGCGGGSEPLCALLQERCL